MSYDVKITGHLPNGGRNELHQVKVAIADALNALMGQGHVFDSQVINGETANLHTPEGRQEAIQASDDYNDVISEAVREARRTSVTTATQAADIAGDDPGLPNRGAPPESPVGGADSDIANPSPEGGPPGTLAANMTGESGAPSGKPSGAANTGAGAQLSQAPKAGEVSSDQSVPQTPTVSDPAKATPKPAT